MAINLLPQVYKKIKEEGIYALISRSCQLGKNKIDKEIFSVVARIASPVEYEGVLIPTEFEVINKGARRQIFQKNWETEETKAINKYLKDSNDFIDLGASTGFSTVYTIKQYDDQVNAVAVEANPNLSKVINKTRKINNTEFRFINAAYHSTKSQVEFNQGVKIEGGTIGEGSTKSVQVPAINLKNIITTNELSNPNLIIDIEGSEKDLINNEIDIIQKHCPLIIIEFHGNSEELIKILDRKGFELLDMFGDVRVFENKSDIYASRRTHDKS